MQHLFVPYELALGLKNRGFDESCFAHYMNRSLNLLRVKGYRDGIELLAPLYQQVVDWFREKHNINIEIVYNDFGGNTTKKENRTWYHYISDMNGEHNNGTHGKEMLPYYEALNKAIEEALKLIK